MEVKLLISYEASILTRFCDFLGNCIKMFCCNRFYNHRRFCRWHIDAAYYISCTHLRQQRVSISRSKCIAGASDSQQEPYPLLHNYLLINTTIVSGII
jgi:hypothetical protein